MRRKFITIAVLAALIAGCGDGTTNVGSPTTTTMASIPTATTTTTVQAAPTIPSGPQPTSMDQLCNLQPWPHPVPEVTSLEVGDVESGALACWDTFKAIAPDGHDVETSTADVTEGKTYRIVDVSPAPGTLVGRNDPVTVRVVPFSLFDAPKTQHPCNWVTNEEAAALLEGSSATTDPTGDETGSVAPFCMYNSGPNSVTSQLYLPGSFPVDAASEFLFRSAVQRSDGGGPAQSSDVDGLPGPARCTTATRDTGPLHTLLVLLRGNRLYVSDALTVPCDTLKQFAQTAIARIGP
jgi:hypothetical protein